jgi:kynurenine formamidase
MPLKPPKSYNTRQNKNRRLTRKDVHAAAKQYRNWGRWGKDDEIGTLNFTTADHIVAAARLVQKGRVFSLALKYDNTGPQGAKSNYPALGRFNPIHLMTRTGTDAYAGILDHRKIRGTDDIIIMPLQCGTQWDGLGHIMYENFMWNGYDCRTVSSSGAARAGIEKTAEKMVGRGVLLDVARAMGRKALPDGFAITNEILDYTEQKQRVKVGRGDYLLVHTGHIQRCLDSKSWDGYSGGDAPGFAFETVGWLHRREIAGVATDTWGAEVRPNETPDTTQPWHWITIPIMGLTVGEIFHLTELAKDCAKDKRYEFLFVAPALPITGAVGSPVNPLAIK